MKLDNASTTQDQERQRASSPTASGSDHTRASDAPTGSKFKADAPTATAKSQDLQPARWDDNGEVTLEWLEWSDRQWLNPVIAHG